MPAYPGCPGKEAVNLTGICLSSRASDDIGITVELYSAVFPFDGPATDSQAKSKQSYPGCPWNTGIKWCRSVSCVSQSAKLLRGYRIVEGNAAEFQVGNWHVNRQRSSHYYSSWRTERVRQRSLQLHVAYLYRDVPEVCRHTGDEIECAQCSITNGNSTTLHRNTDPSANDCVALW